MLSLQLNTRASCDKRITPRQQTGLLFVCCFCFVLFCFLMCNCPKLPGQPSVGALRVWDGGLCGVVYVQSTGTKKKQKKKQQKELQPQHISWHINTLLNGVMIFNFVAIWGPALQDKIKIKELLSIGNIFQSPATTSI